MPFYFYRARNFADADLSKAPEMGLNMTNLPLIPSQRVMMEQLPFHTRDHKASLRVSITEHESAGQEAAMVIEAASRFVGARISANHVSQLSAEIDMKYGGDSMTPVIRWMFVIGLISTKAAALSTLFFMGSHLCHTWQNLIAASW